MLPSKDGREEKSFLVSERSFAYNNWHFCMNMKVYLYNRISSKYYKIFPFGEMIESLNSHINMKHIFLCIRGLKKYTYH